MGTLNATVAGRFSDLLWQSFWLHNTAEMMENSSKDTKLVLYRSVYMSTYIGKFAECDPDDS